MKRLFIILFFSVLSFSLVGNTVVHAQTAVCDLSTSQTCPQVTTTITLNNPFSATCGSGTCGVLDLLHAIVDNILMPIGGVLAVLGFIWSGFLYVMAQGNATKIKDATRALSYTAIGTAILLGAYAISAVISGTITQLGGPKL